LATTNGGTVIKKVMPMVRLLILYDQYGRILSKTTPEISTTYFYNTDGLLQEETSNNGTGKNITYDALGRTVTFKETGTDSKWLQKSYTYVKGQLSTVSYTT
jgi:YD repeat-containing protein